MDARCSLSTVSRTFVAVALGLLAAFLVVGMVGSSAQGAVKPAVGSYKGTTAQGYDVTFRVVKKPAAWWVVGPKFTIRDPGGCLRTTWLRWSEKVRPAGAFAFLKADPARFWGRFTTNKAVSGWAQDQFGCYPYVGRLQFTANYVG